jgi:hypothetical protein
MNGTAPALERRVVYSKNFKKIYSYILHEKTLYDERVLIISHEALANKKNKINWKHFFRGRVMFRARVVPRLKLVDPDVVTSFNLKLFVPSPSRDVVAINQKLHTQSVVIITGPIGSGKSMLAFKSASDYATDYHNIGFCDFRGLDEYKILDQLSREVSTWCSQNNTEKDNLLILDSVIDKQVILALFTICRSIRCQLIVTTVFDFGLEGLNINMAVFKLNDDIEINKIARKHAINLKAELDDFHTLVAQKNLVRQPLCFRILAHTFKEDRGNVLFGPSTSGNELLGYLLTQPLPKDSCALSFYARLKAEVGQLIFCTDKFFHGELINFHNAYGFHEFFKVEHYIEHILNFFVEYKSVLPIDQDFFTKLFTLLLRAAYIACRKNNSKQANMFIT